MADEHGECADIQDVRDVLDVNRGRIRVERQRINPFEEFDDEEFRRRYRLRKETVNFVIDLVREDLESISHQVRNITPELQVLIALRFFAKGCYQVELGDLHGVSQPTVSRIVARVSRSLAAVMHRFVKFPERMEELKTEFYSIAGFPKVVGCVDCTHVRIKNPDKENPMLYCNRKGFHSLNVQVVCDARCRILDIVARWRGSAHDSRIWENCTLKEKFENSTYSGIILGDGGYPCRNYLLTPLLNPQTAAEEAYNRSHIRTRNTVERTFGQWKSMFRSLRNGMQISLASVKAAIVAMAVLYNIKKNMENEDATQDDDENSDDSDEEVHQHIIQAGNEGNLFRRNFIQTYFA